MPINNKDNNEVATKNKRLAVVLGLISLTIYVGYILAYYF